MKLEEERKMPEVMVAKDVFIELVKRFEDGEKTGKYFVDDNGNMEVNFEVAADKTIHGDFKDILHGIVYAGCSFWGCVSIIEEGRWMATGQINVNELERFKELASD